MHYGTDRRAFLQSAVHGPRSGSGSCAPVELPNKINLTRDNYLTVQQIYRGWALLGFVVAGALPSTLILALKSGTLDISRFRENLETGRRQT
jgi:hypothetical protein